MTRGWAYNEAAGGFKAVELPPQTPADDEVVIAVEAAVVAQSDLVAAKDNPGRVPGRAAVGRVASTGAAATEWQDARVVVGPHQACGECDLCQMAVIEHCESGWTLGTQVPGTLRSHVVARARWLSRVDGQLSLPGSSAALIAGPAGLAYSAYARGGIAPGEPVVIIGSNAVSRMLEQVAHAKGALVVRSTVDAGPKIVHDRLATLRDIHRLEGDAATVFETSETAAGRTLATELTAPGTAVVMIAQSSTESDESAQMASSLESTLTLVCVREGHPDLFPEVSAMAVKKEIDIESATDALPIADLAELPERAERGVTYGSVPVVTL